MGLDMAEIVMELEDEFDVNIPDELPSVKTFGDFADYICETVVTLSGKEAEKRQALEQFARLAASHSDGGGADVSLDRLLADLEVPRTGRRRFWRLVRRQLGKRVAPLELQPSHHRLVVAMSQVLGAVVGCLAGFGVMTAYANTNGVWSKWIPGLILVLIVGAVAGCIAGASLFVAVRKLFAREYPSRYHTVGDIVSHAAGGRPPGNPEQVKQYVEERVRAIVAEQADLPPEEITRDKELYADLGLG